jgi:hypothetical protein
MKAWEKRRQLIARPEHEVGDDPGENHDREARDCILDRGEACWFGILGWAGFDSWLHRA